MGQSREIVVTGGGTGIGYAVAAKFAAAGESVTITGRREGVLAESAALLGAKYVAFDAADANAVEQALAELPERVDVLVNNAGGNTDRIREKATDLAGVADAWRANYEANVVTTVLVTTALQPRLAERARVVTVGSIAAKAGSGSYGAAKAALESWNVQLAKQLGTSGATANIVAPGVVLDTEFFQGTLDEKWLKSRTSAAINQRAGQPDEVADAIFFLAGAGAGHITGQVLHVNGGAHLGS